MESEYLILGCGGLIISLLAVMFSRRTGVATPLLLMAFGFLASLIPGAPDVHLDPELILAGVLPPLLYASAVRLPVTDFRRNLGLIMWLSVVMVVAGALIVGFAVHLVFDIPLALSVALGAVVSPTDAVAATAIGRRVGLPARPMAVLEGESLVNDATALVLLRTSVAAASVGVFSLGDAIADFAWAVAGAAISGVVVAWITILIRQRLNDPILSISFSFATPFLAFVPAEEMGASGVLAVVIAGLITGHEAGKRFSARDRQTERTNWATVNFLLEHLVFIVMGLELVDLVEQARTETADGTIIAMVGVVFAVLVVFRFVGLAGPLLLERRLRPRRTDRRQNRIDLVADRLAEFTPETEREERLLRSHHRRVRRGQADVDFALNEPLTGRAGLVLGWAGMRGVVTLAAVQTLPLSVEKRSTLVVVGLLVAIITLVLFGLTLPAIIRRLGLVDDPPEEHESEFFTLMRHLAAATQAEVGPLEEVEIDGERIDPELAKMLSERFTPILMGRLHKMRQRKPGIRQQSLSVQKMYLDVMRDELIIERSIGAYSSEAYAQAEAYLDREEQRIAAAP